MRNGWCVVQYRILLSGAWNTLCCIPASVDAADGDVSEEQQLLDTDGFHSSLYTENRQQVTAHLRLPVSPTLFVSDTLKTQ